MGNKKTSWKLPQSVMYRVQACAILFMDSSRKIKIDQIAESKGITQDEAAIMYTIGALKAAKRRGTARNYNEALDALEAEQVGDRGNRITRSVSADDTARTVTKINRINAGNRNDPVYLVSTDSGKSWTPFYSIIQEKPEVSNRRIGKVIGTLYSEWEEREAQADPAEEFNRRERLELEANAAQVKRNLDLFFNEYQNSLSKTVQERLIELVQSNVSAGYLTSRAGQNDPETKKAAWFATHLFQNFPHKENLCCREFIELLREHLPA